MKRCRSLRTRSLPFAALLVCALPATGSAQTLIEDLAWAYAITPGSFAQFIEHVVPVLTERGAYQPAYTPGTLRHKLFGKGDRLPDDHRGSRYRVGGPLSTIIDRPSTLPSSPASAASQPISGR